MPEGKIVAEGVWCKECEFFEIDTDIEMNGRPCQSCGCRQDTHVRVRVVVS